MSQVPNAGCKEILFWKVIYSVICSVFAQVLFLTTFLFIMNFSIIEPDVWIEITFSTLTSLSTWLFLIPLASIIFAQGVICSKDYVFETIYPPNRMSKFVSILSLRNLFLLCLHMITGALIVWLYLSLLGGQYGSIYKNCYSNDQCLVEETLFTILNGFWIGLYYFLRSFITDGKSIVFPVIQQRKLLLVKSNMIVKLKQAMHEAIWPTLYFVVLYYYRGAYFRKLIIGLFVLSQDKEPLHLYDMFSSSLLLYSWLFSTLFIFTMLCMRLFFEVFLTEHWKFPIESNVSHILSLKEGLAMNNIPIIQHLACLDLYMLSLWDPRRRQTLFTLSQPGGHPHNWNNVLQEVLHFITEHSTELNKASDAILALDSSKETSDVPNTEPTGPTSQKSIIVNESIYENTYSPQRLRNMALPRPESVDIVNVTQTVFFANAIEKIRSAIVAKVSQLKLAIRKKSGVQYFFGDRPEARIYYLLSKGQPIIWAIQGLAFLATASLKEDNYGVVQKDLPVILTTLVNLKQNLDKLNKVSVVSRKNSQSELYKMQLKAALRSAVKRSLYSICTTFGDYLPHIKLNKDVQVQVQTFISCREG